MPRGLLKILLSLLLGCGIQQSYALTTSLADAIELLRTQGHRILYSSDSEQQVGTLKLSEVSLISLRNALHEQGFELLKVGEVWVISYRKGLLETVVGTLVGEAGQPIAGGEVRVTGADKRIITGEDGSFVLDKVAVGATLEVSSRGYLSQFVIVDSSKVGDIILLPEGWIENIIVTGSHYRFPFQSATQPAFSMTVDEIRLTPSLGSDSIRVANRLPGVSSVGVTSKPRIRGGLQDEVLIILDGVELIEPFHLADFNNGYSSIDGRAIESLDIYTGGFPARYGNRMSGVIDVTTDRELPEYPHEIGISVFSQFANTRGQTDSDRPLQWMLSVRKGNLEELIEFMEPRVGKPRYFDAVGRLNTALTDRIALTLGTVVTSDDISFTDDEESASAKVDNYYLWSRMEVDHRKNLHSTLLLSGVKIDREKQELSFDSPRDCRRLIFLRGLANEQTTRIFKRSTRTRSTPCLNQRA